MSRRALISVYDKQGLVPFVRGLAELDWQLITSGKTAAALREAGIDVTDVAEVTGAPEMLGGRVKTLHPVIHGGILADRSKPEHLADLEARGIEPIDLVVSNLYPFTSDPSVELIDIGGPTLVRAAAKNHQHVGIVVDPSEYDGVLAELRKSGWLSDATRRRLARAAFAHTATYDAAIVAWLDEEDADPTDDGLPRTLHYALERAQDLRYGENPHQIGARYRFAGHVSWWDTAIQHGGKELSYLNLYDSEAAWRLVHSLGDDPAAVVIKHANPCGVAVAGDIEAAYQRAHECDPVSAFGGIVAVNRPVTHAMAEALAPVFTEVVVAPAFESDALLLLLEKRNLRVLEAEPPHALRHHLRSIDEGLLVQTPDLVTVDRDAWQVVTKRAPSADEWNDLEMAWRVVAAVTSNSIVLVKDQQAVGIGAGQQNRRDAGRIAAEKAEGRAKGGACASDAFFPFRDGLDAAADAGATAVIQPGGSVRDEEVIDAADEQGLAMVFTSERHFKH
jgi:phosphoribosylaminoimidazolecarboxamide formyltransferase/IMP cyclohydrolase